MDCKDPYPVDCAQGFLLVYDVTDRSTFDDIRERGDKLHQASIDMYRFVVSHVQTRAAHCSVLVADNYRLASQVPQPAQVQVSEGIELGTRPPRFALIRSAAKKWACCFFEVAFEVRTLQK